MTRTWLITGAGRGMGVEFARAALALGHDVVATGRDPDAVRSAVGEHENLLVTALDVTDPHSAEAAAAAAVERFGRIDVLLNNAGSFLTGFFEGLTTEQVRSPGFLRTELLTPESATFGELAIDDYAEVREQLNAFWASMNGTQAGDPAKLAQALVQLADSEEPPLRWVAGEDAVGGVEGKAQLLLAQVDAHRELSTSLAHEDAKAAA